MRRHHILIPLAAFLATLPLILRGCSCGHDFDFHLQSWLDAAQQLRHGTLYPHWAFSAAYSAGEPRFLFYPPISWLLGAILTLAFPTAATPAIYTFLALTAAGFAMHHLASHFVSPNAAVLAAILYLANPYMLFNAFERTAYAELLAAAWIPLLFLAVLRKRPTIHGIAIPLALLWLTNAPAAVMGTYTFALIAALRLIQATISSQQKVEASRTSPLQLTTTYICGFTLGLALPAFYLIPAAYERRYVQIAMAIIPNMRIQDNFLFGHTADAPHNTVLHTASLLAVTLLAITAAATATLFIQAKTRVPRIRIFGPGLPQTLAILTLVIAFLLIPISTSVWLHLPELAFLQFPWRLLTILATILALALALFFNTLSETTNTPDAPFIAWSHRAMSGKAITLAAPVAALALGLLCIHLYRQPCETADLPTSVAQAFNTHHGVAPTDEYTPTHADNDYLRPNDPAYWLSPDPSAFAPNTTPNPAATDPNFDGDIPDSETLSARVPHHFEFHADKREYLILNLRDYPAWDLTKTDSNSLDIDHTPHVQREDGLLAIPLYNAGDYKIDITWHRTLDQTLGLALTACSLLALAFSFYREQKPGAPSSPQPHRG